MQTMNENIGNTQKTSDNLSIVLPHIRSLYYTT